MVSSSNSHPPTGSETPIAQLEQEVQSAITEYQGLKQLNQGIGLGLGISGIVLSFLATVAGIVGTETGAKMAAGFAAASSALQAALFAYPVDKRSSFYRVMEARGKNLAIDLKFQPYTQADTTLVTLLEMLKALRLEAAKEPESSQLAAAQPANSEVEDDRDPSQAAPKPDEPQ